VFRKIGAVNAYSENHFLWKKKSGGFDLSQNRRLAMRPTFGRKNSFATTTVFFISVVLGQSLIFKYK